MFHENFESLGGTLISLRSPALALTLSPAGGGIPRSEGAVFPFLLILEGTPPLPQRRSETEGSLKNGGTPLKSSQFSGPSTFLELPFDQTTLSVARSDCCS